MDELTPVPQNSLPEDLQSSAEQKPVTELKSKFKSKKFILLGVLVLAVIATSVVTLNTDLFKGSLFDTLDYNDFAETAFNDVKISSLFNEYYLNDSLDPKQNKLIFFLEGQFPATDTGGLISPANDISDFVAGSGTTGTVTTGDSGPLEDTRSVPDVDATPVGGGSVIGTPATPTVGTSGDRTITPVAGSTTTGSFSAPGTSISPDDLETPIKVPQLDESNIVLPDISTPIVGPGKPSVEDIIIAPDTLGTVSTPTGGLTKTPTTITPESNMTVTNTTGNVSAPTANPGGLTDTSKLTSTSVGDSVTNATTYSVGTTSGITSSSTGTKVTTDLSLPSGVTSTGSTSGVTAGVSPTSLFGGALVKGDLSVTTSTPVASSSVASQALSKSLVIPSKYFLNVKRIGASGNGFDIEMSGNAINPGDGSNVITINVDKYLSELQAGKYTVFVKKADYLTEKLYKSASTTFEVVTSASSYENPFKLQARMDETNGLQYRILLTDSVNAASVNATYLKSRLRSARLKFAPTSGDNVYENLTTADIVFETNETGFPAASDPSIALPRLSSLELAGVYDVSAEMTFNFPASINPTAPDGSTNVVLGALDGATNAVRVTIAAAEVPGGDDTPPALTCSDRYPANAIAVDSSSIDFGTIEVDEEEESTFEIKRGTLAGLAPAATSVTSTPLSSAAGLSGTATGAVSGTAVGSVTRTDISSVLNPDALSNPAVKAINLPYELIVVIEEESSPIHARIGGVALQEDVADTRAVFDFNSPLEVTVEFTPSREGDFDNAILIYDPRVPGSCDPIGRIALSGEGEDDSSSGSGRSGSGGGSRRIVQQGSIVGGGSYTTYSPAPPPGPYTTYEDYLASMYNVNLPAGATNSGASAPGGPSTPSASSASDSEAATTEMNEEPMPIAETGPGLLVYPALLAASGFAARRMRKQR